MIPSNQIILIITTSISLIATLISVLGKSTNNFPGRNWRCYEAFYEWIEQMLQFFDTFFCFQFSNLELKRTKENDWHRCCGMWQKSITFQLKWPTLPCIGFVKNNLLMVNDLGQVLILNDSIRSVSVDKFVWSVKKVNGLINRKISC